MSRGDLKASILLQFQAEQARREMAATAGDLKVLGASAEEAGRRSSAAGQGIAQTGTAAGTTAASVESLGRASAVAAGQAEGLAAASGRVAAAATPATATIARLGTTAKSSAGSTANLAAQWNDLIVMMAAGQNPMQLALQQGGQINQELMLMGGGKAALRGLGTSFLALLNPMSLATFGIIAFGAAGVQWLMSLGGEAKSFEDELESLNDVLGRMKTGLDRLADRRPGETFGSFAGEVRTLTLDLLELDRAAELKSLSGLINKAGENPNENWFEWATRHVAGGFVASSGVASQEELDRFSARGAGYEELGSAISYPEFEARTGQIGALAKAGNVGAVLKEVTALQSAMAGGGPFTDMSDELQKLLVDLAETALKVAEVEALWNGTAKAERITRQVGEIVRSYDEQAELAQAILRFGESSAEVEAVRAKQAREALRLKLEDMDVAKGSAEEVRAQAALEAALNADAAASAEKRRKTQSDMLADMLRQSEVSAAILNFGAGSAAVEEIRARQAREVLQARLEEQRVSQPLIWALQLLTRLEQQRAKAIKEGEAAREADRMLADLREEAALGAAILRYGADSLVVKEAQIAAERRAFEESLAHMQITDAKRAEMLAEWDRAKGLGAADPFGIGAAAADYARDQAERIEKLRLERDLLGQREDIQQRTIALWEVERDLRRQNIDLTSARAAEIRAAALEELELTRSIERQKSAWGAVQSSAESAIDSIIEKLRGGDISGALEDVAGEIERQLTTLAIANPLKNAVLGTNYGTLQDVGGLKGIWARLTGQGDPGLPGPAGQTVGSMQVTAGTVVISGGAGVTGLFGGAAGDLMAGGMAANGQAMAILSGVATGGGARADAISGLSPALGNPLAAMVARAQGLFGADAVQVTSGFRSNERQAQLWAEALAKYGSPEAARKWVAPPGQSRHNYGLAADLQFGSPEVQQWFHQNAGQFGLGFRMANEPWHIEPQGAASMMQAAQAATKFGTAADTATGQLGTLGNGFGSFGQFLAQALSGGAGGGGFLQTLISLGAQAFGIPGFAGGGQHRGGLRIVGEAGPELEYTGPSTILPADLTRALLTTKAPVLALPEPANSAPPMQVIVHNYSGQPVQTEERTDAQGRRTAIMTIGEQGAAALRQPGNPMRRAMLQEYGARPRGIAR